MGEYNINNFPPVSGTWVDQNSNLVDMTVMLNLTTATPVVNALTVTTGQVELKAGASALTGRKQLIIYPPAAGTIYWGSSGVTSSTGAPMTSTSQPLSFTFNPNIYVALYAVSDGTNRTVQVVEAK